MLYLRSSAILLLLLFLSLHVFSKDNIRYNYNNKLTLKLTPLSFIDIKNPLIMLGTEYTFMKRVAVEIGGGIPFSMPRAKRFGVVLHSDLKLRTGIKYYLNDSKRYRSFLMLRCHYRRMLVTGDNISMETEYDLYDYDYIKMVRRSLNPAFYIGGAFVPDGHFFFDWYAGVVQYNVDVDIISQQGRQLRGETFGWFKATQLNYTSDTFGAYPSIGFSIGYIFGKTSK